MGRDVRPEDWWVVGTVLARALGVKRTTLQSAVRDGRLSARKTGDGLTVVRFRDAERWAMGRAKG